MWPLLVAIVFGHEIHNFIPNVGLFIYDVRGVLLKSMMKMMMTMMVTMMEGFSLNPG